MTNKKAIIGVVAVMAVLLVVLSFFLFKKEPVDPQPTDPVLQGTTLPTTAKPTTATPTVKPTTATPSTQPKPHSGVVTVNKQFFNTNETVTFSCVTLSGMSTLRVYLPDGTEKTYTNVGTSVTMKATVVGSYTAVLETVTNQGVAKSEPAHFVVAAVPTQPTTKKPTTKPTTAKPTTVKPTTVAPTTVAPTTPKPTTVAPTTVAPTTPKPTTVAPTTVAPTTPKPTTVAPTTAAPTTAKPTTAAPTTAKPTTAAPTTAKPTTAAPTTPKPTTVAPTTPKPTTVAPTTPKPTTAKPTTAPTTAPTTKPTVNMNGTFYITQNGAGKATLVISENYTDKALEAANDLYDYIWRISGAEIDFIFDDGELEQDKFYILVGPTKYHASLGIEVPKGYPNNEKLIIQRKGNVLALIGNDDGAFTGTQYAVTRFLEELGCGWFGTQDLWNVVPSNKTITIEQMNIVETPKFIARGTNRLNSGKTADLAKRWYMGGVETLVGQHFLMSYVGNSAQTSNPNWYARNSNGTQMYPLGKQSSWPDQYWQFCYSDAGLRNRVAEVVKNYFKSNPNCYVFSITPNDGWDFGTCQCATCRGYDYGGPNVRDTHLIIDFANAVAENVAKTYPDRYVSFLTYHSTLEAPFVDQRKVHKNVEIMFCTETSMTQPLSQVNYIGIGGDKITNISWKQNFLNYVNKTGVQQRSVWKWLCIAAENAAWQYIPWVQGNVATDDHTFWKNNGVKYVFYDQGPLGGYREYENSLPLRWPLWYVANRGCWTQDKTGMQLLEDACKKLYGAGWDEMLAYYQALANASAACTARSHAWAAPAASSVYTASQRSTIDAKVNAAKAVYGQVTAVQKQRMENQLGLWATAKSHI